MSCSLDFNRNHCMTSWCVVLWNMTKEFYFIRQVIFIFVINCHCHYFGCHPPPLPLLPPHLCKCCYKHCICDAILGNQSEVEHVTFSVILFDQSLHYWERYILLITWPELDRPYRRFQSYSNWKILKTIENKRNTFLFLPVSHNQCAWLPTDPTRSHVHCYALITSIIRMAQRGEGGKASLIMSN